MAGMFSASEDKIWDLSTAAHNDILRRLAKMFEKEDPELSKYFIRHTTDYGAYYIDFYNLENDAYRKTYFALLEIFEYDKQNDVGTERYINNFGEFLDMYKSEIEEREKEK